MGRMYESYKLKISDDDGERYIKINKNVDTSNYKEMIKFYNELKKRNEEKSCTIHFLGVDKNKIENIMFSKEYKKEVNNDKELLTTTDEIVGDIKHLLGLLERKKDYHHDMRSVLDKKNNIALHKIENIRLFEGSKEDLIKEKIKIFDEMDKIIEERRTHKEELKKLSTLRKIIDLDNIIDNFNRVNIPIDETDYKYLTDEVIEEKKILKEYTYRNDKERLNIMKQIENKYSKIVNDSVNNKLICYNLANNRNKIK